MFRFDEALKVYVHRERVDFRKSINGLSALVEQELKLDPFAAALFVFTNRTRTRVKILTWQGNGYWLMLKRLEADRFVWPQSDAPVIHLTVQELHWLLEGIDLTALRGHPLRRYRRAS